LSRHVVSRAERFNGFQQEAPQRDDGVGTCLQVEERHQSAVAQGGRIVQVRQRRAQLAFQGSAVNLPGHVLYLSA